MCAPTVMSEARRTAALPRQSRPSYRRFPCDAAPKSISLYHFILSRSGAQLTTWRPWDVVHGLQDSATRVVRPACARRQSRFGSSRAPSRVHVQVPTAPTRGAELGDVRGVDVVLVVAAISCSMSNMIVSMLSFSLILPICISRAAARRADGGRVDPQRPFQGWGANSSCP